MAVTTVSTFPGGTLTTMDLPASNQFNNTQISFSRSTGTVTVRGRAVGAGAFRAYGNNVVDLATQNVINLPNVSLAQLEFSDAGAGSYTVTVIQTKQG